jgi:hypothetical protein
MELHTMTPMIYRALACFALELAMLAAFQRFL